MKIISDNLLHFIDRKNHSAPFEQFEIFKKILSSGLRFSKEKIIFPEGVVWNDVVCFTDIPLNFCDEHTERYGKFGIGFKKAFVKNVGGNPALYYVDCKQDGSSRGMLQVNLSTMVKSILVMKEAAKLPELGIVEVSGAKVALDEKFFSTAASEFTQIMSHFKNIGDLGPVRDDSPRSDQDQFYYEREWRVVAYTRTIEAKKIYEESSHKFLKFSRADLTVIVVPNRDIRKKLLEWLENSANFEGSAFKNDTCNFEDFKRDPIPILVYDELQSF